MNVVILQGTLSRPAALHELPSGSTLLALELTVRSSDGTDTVPVSWFDPPATAAASLDTGAEVVVTGRVRRRFFRAGGATQSRTEVVADAVVPARRAAKAAAAVARAIERAGGRSAPAK